MRARTVIAAIAAGVWLAAAAPAAQRPSFSVLEYDLALTQLIDGVQHLDERAPAGADEIVRALPPQWTVTSEAGTWRVPTDALRHDLIGWRDQPDPAARAALVRFLQVERSNVRARNRAAGDAPAARAALARILADPAFRDVHGPNWSETLLARVMRWIVQLLGRLVGTSSFPTIGRVLVYSLATIATLLVAYVLYRLLRSGAHAEALSLDTPPATVKPWTTWLADARRAAAGSDWRQAIHDTYWAGVTFLDARAARRPDPARTPREYLALLPATEAARPPLGALTRLLERVWYGRAEADAAGFAEALANLEKLGCPLT